MNKVGQIGPMPDHGGRGKNNSDSSKWRMNANSISLVTKLIERGVNGECAFVEAIPGRSKDVSNDARSAREAINTQIRQFASVGLEGWEYVSAWQREIVEDKCVYIVVEYNNPPKPKKRKLVRR